jgi:DNA-binding MarR family transcriptional regulator
LRTSSGQTKAGPDLLLRAGAHRFAVEYKPSGAAGPVATAIEQLGRHATDSRELIPVVAVPYMGDVGRNICEKSGVNWIDLSGNAHLSAPGLLIHVQGRPNLFKATGRPSDVFAPKSSRITRALLANHVSAWSVRGLAGRTQVDPGLTSRIIGRLEADGLIQGMHRKSDRRLDAVRATQPGLLLDAWRDEYKFFRHDVLQGHMPARASGELLRDLDKILTRAGIKHAATGLGAAWAFTHFATFRLVTFFVRERPETFLRDIGFREDPRGANVWLVVPNDEGVFQETQTSGDYDARARHDERKIRCVHPVQVYLDLKDHPERAVEAATELRSRLLGW